MTYSFNLIEQPWIPCVDTEGSVIELSLRETLVQAHNLRSIAGDSPLETAALYRLLLAVLHSALRGPENAAAWNELWQAGKWEAPWLHDYLGTWKHRFDLFDPERPFYQARDDRVEAKSIISLVMDMVSGNNATLFDHHLEETGVLLFPPKAARVVVTAQTFGLAGFCNPKQKLTFTDAPWTRGIIFFVESDNLFETLALNMLRYDDKYPQDIPLTNDDDAPAWEMADPYSPQREIPQGYLDYLTWQNRRILIIPNGEMKQPSVANITVTPGLRLDASLLDPFKHFRKDDLRGMLPLRFSEDRVLWRDSSVLFHIHNPEHARPPSNFEWVANLADKNHIKQHQTLRLMALGMANDQAKIEFFHQEHMPLPLDYLENDKLVGMLTTALDCAEETRKSLWSAASWMAVLIVAPNSDGKNWKNINRVTKDQASQLYYHWAVERFYWSALELPFFTLLESLPDDSESALNVWETKVRRTAWNAMEKAAELAGENIPALKAAVRARSILGGSLKGLFPELEKEVSV